MQEMLPKPFSRKKPCCTQACEKPLAFPWHLWIFFRTAHASPRSQFLSYSSRNVLKQKRTLLRRQIRMKVSSQSQPLIPGALSICAH